MELYELPKDIPIATRCAGSACALILRGETFSGYGKRDRVKRKPFDIDKKAAGAGGQKIAGCGSVCSACVSSRLRNSESCIFLGSARASRNELTRGTAHVTRCSTTPKDTTLRALPWQRQPPLYCPATTSRRAPCQLAQAKRRRSPSDPVCDIRRQTRSRPRSRARS